MSQLKDVEVGSPVYFWFAANLTTGAAGDGATPLYDVRLAGAAADAAPTASGTPTLLTHANYTDGLHEIAIDTTGYAAGEYAVFCTLTISTVNPAGFCGSFRVVAVGDSLHSAAARIMDAIPNAAAGAAGGLFIAGSNAATSVTTALTANITGNLSGSVGSVTSKTGYSLAATGLDSITATEPGAKPTTFPGWLMWLVQWFRRSDKTPTTITVKTEAGATVTTQTITDDGNGTESLGAPS